MTKTLAILIILALLLSIVEPIIQINPASANGYPGRWPMFRFSQEHSGYYYWAAPTSNETLWTYSTGSHILNSPAVSAEGIVYFGASNGKVYAVQAADGSDVWNYTTGGAILSSPAVVDGMVFVGSDDGKVYCLDALYGTQIWNYTTGDGIGSSPTVADGYVFIGSDDWRLYKLDEYTGILIWSCLVDAGISVAPAVYNNVIWFGTDAGTVYCIDEDSGGEYWNFTAGAGIYSSPSYADGYIFVGSSDYHLYCLNGATGTEIWNFTDSSQVSSSPAAACGLVYFGTDSGNFYGLDGSTGNVVWSYLMHGGYCSSPAVTSNYVYVSSYDTVYAFYTIPGPLLGTILWSYYVSPTYLSSVALYNSTLFIGSNDGNLYAVKSTTSGITFDASGVPAGTPGTILVIDMMLEYTLADLPATITPNHGETVIFEWKPVWTADYSEQYGWKSGSGLNQTMDHGIFIATEDGTIEAVYGLTHARITFTILNVPVGWGQNNTGFCLTINGRQFYRTDFDQYGDMNLTFAGGETFTYAWTSILSDQVGNNYTFRACSGLATTRVGNIYVTHAGSLIGRYECEYVLVAFEETGLPSATFWATVDGTELTLPTAQFRWQYGSIHSYEIEQNVTVSGTPFYLTNVSGLTDLAGYSITATVSGVINATYSDSHLFWGESDFIVNSIATRHAKTWKEFYAVGRFWGMYSNSSNQLVFQSAVYASLSIATWANPVYFGRDGYLVKTYDFVVYYDQAHGFVHCAFILSGNVSVLANGFHYRRGQPNSDGTITWTTAWQQVTVLIGIHVIRYQDHVSIVADSAGCPFVGVIGATGSTGLPPVQRVHVIYTTQNNGTFQDPIREELGSYSNYYATTVGAIVLSALSEGRVMAVYTYLSDAGGSNHYYLQSCVWSGASWSSDTNILPRSLTPYMYDTNSMAVASDGTNNVYLTYLNPDASAIYAYKHVMGGAWTSVEIVTFAATTTTFPAIAVRSDRTEIYWANVNTVYGSWLNGTTWSDPFTVKVLNASSTYCNSINSFTHEMGGKFGIAITFERGGTTRVALLYQPSLIPTWNPAPSDDDTFYGVPWTVIFFLFGAICLIVGIVYTIKGIKEGDKAEALNGFMAIFIGLGMFLGALL